ncbi:hypothetical protein HF086_002942 [Spodoptera exigua]|uniref:Uncharacterized protein n=1 Tax=Spodoptera exigua TaxID=7107 RepID=A0A922SIK8_SPOEX|nr:hypothetical protein HF086_002942 [Spodoptera exigua]
MNNEWFQVMLLVVAASALAAAAPGVRYSTVLYSAPRYASAALVRAPALVSVSRIVAVPRTQLVVLCACAVALGEPLGQALHRLSRYGMYADEYARDYEPYLFAAVPLHAPVPVLRVLSPAPLQDRERAVSAPSRHQPVYARAPYHDASYEVEAYEPPPYDRYAGAPNQLSQSPPLYVATAAGSAAEETTVLYARPTPQGGYTYHTAPAPHRSGPAKRAPAADSPYMIRVHKYRVVKDR